MPWAPERIALCCALRMARRNCTPGCKLLSHALRHQLGVGFGVLDLEDVQLDLLAGELLQSLRTRSASAPLRPMTMPGRAV